MHLILIYLFKFQNKKSEHPRDHLSLYQTYHQFLAKVNRNDTMTPFAFCDTFLIK